MTDSVIPSRRDFLPELLSDLARQASFGANIVDAHSCFIFLPESLLAGKARSASSEAPQDCDLLLAACYSLGPDLVKNARIPSDTGLIGWVARHRRSIHVSPFEQDSRTLGVYLSDQHLKSFIGIPVPLGQTAAATEQACGVIACDSCKTYAFSKLQGKLLENLAQEISNTIRLHLIKRELAGSASSWQDFILQAVHLSEQLGRKSFEIMRLKPRNLENLELDLGTAECLNLTEQLYTLIRQSLPANFPTITLANGDIVIALDNMTTSFYENRIRALCDHVKIDNHHLKLEYSRRSFRDKRYVNATIERLVADSAIPEMQGKSVQGELYEQRQRRA